MKKIISTLCLAMFLSACAIGCSGSSTSAPVAPAPKAPDTKMPSDGKTKPGS